ncbi:MAG: NAD-dependent epimerase/dehydratase family protein [Acidobacteria bacterium]|nr:MAG: NAD-dependent epimerase/dehydratase family protein [Acidobacteriota bacterium]
MKKVLVTGGAGFIGSHLSERLRREDVNVVVLDNFDPFYEPALKRRNLRHLEKDSGFRLVEGDIRDEDLVNGLFARERFDTVFHLAARAGVRPSLEEPRLYQDVNVVGTVTLLEAARVHEVGCFVFGSSSSVYGNNKKVPFAEDDPVDHPISPYAASKKAGELVAYTYHHLYGLDISCLRFFTVYGPRQRPEMAIHKFTRLISQGRPVPRFGGGGTVRDYTYIDDIIDGVMAAAEKSRGYRIYNLGESLTTPLSRLIELIEESVGRKADVREEPAQPGDVECTFADVTRARGELGYAPSVPVEQGIPRFVEWYRREVQE